MSRVIQRNTGRLDFATVANLRAFLGGTSLVDGDAVTLLGYYAAGDTDSRVLTWDSSNITNDNGGNHI